MKDSLTLSDHIAVWLDPKGDLNLVYHDGEIERKRILPPAFIPMLVAWLDGNDTANVRGWGPFTSPRTDDPAYRCDDGECSASDSELMMMGRDGEAQIMFFKERIPFRREGPAGIEIDNEHGREPFDTLVDASARRPLLAWLRAHDAGAARLPLSPNTPEPTGYIYLVVGPQGRPVMSIERLSSDCWGVLGSADRKTWDDLRSRFKGCIIHRAESLLVAPNPEWRERAASARSVELYAGAAYVGAAIPEKTVLAVDLATDEKATGERWMARGPELPSLRPNTGYATKDEAISALKEAWLDRKKTA